jgi:ABC-2 type transport system ATP-binding protein
MNEDVLRNYAKIGRKVAVLFENHGLYSHLTAWENLEFYARLMGMPVDEQKMRIHRSLETMGLIERKNNLVKDFSKGMLRKLAITRALLIDPQILILDEPFDGIDVSSRLLVSELLKAWIKEEQHCILLASHNMYELEEMCDEIVIINQNEIVASGSIESLQNDTRLAVVEIALKEQYEHTFIQKVMNKHMEDQSFTLCGKKLILSNNNGKEASDISSILCQNDIKFDAIFKKRESLNEIYLRVVGHHE